MMLGHLQGARKYEQQDTSPHVEMILSADKPHDA